MSDEPSYDDRNVCDESPAFDDFMLHLMKGISQATDFSNTQKVRPPWFDEERFKRGQQVFKDNYFSFTGGTLSGMVIGFSVIKAIGPIVLGRNADTALKSFKRFTKAIVKIQSWYYSDPFQKGTEAYKNMVITNVLHRNGARKMASIPERDIDTIVTVAGGPEAIPVMSTSRQLIIEDLRAICPFSSLAPNEIFETRKTPLNQFDLSSSIFVVFGLPVMYPERFGLHHVTEDELEDFIYVWRCFYYLLKVEDEFNWCSGNLLQLRQRGQFAVDNLFKPSFANASEDWEHICRCLGEGMAYILPGISFEIIFKHLCGTINLSVPRFERAMSLSQKMFYEIYWFLLSVVCRIPVGVKILNKLTFFAIKRAERSLEHM